MVSTGQLPESPKKTVLQSPRKRTRTNPPHPLDLSANDQLSCHSIVKRRRTARRALFGRADEKDTDRWLQGLEDEIMAEKTARWDFDFRRGVPLHSSNLPGPSTSSVIYEALDTKNVPQFYHPKTLPSQNAQNRQNDHGVRNLGCHDYLPSEEPVSPRKAIVTFKTPQHRSSSVDVYSHNHRIFSPTKLRKNSALEEHKTPGKKNPG
ncbi:cyclin-dependent kinase inhibitor domain-containing protein [Ditylenchus destructor]|uniref:Cyclin-dependent kinase inhibitor domain-containing protein n=1 Tax=Ditylenchus destructor TaxID=166010 RepID=A0AAD4MYY8_9BILA|nr:cyclin-dependent kinase inhibitor domain-containing protein [Ditylenchus destructor]